VNLLFCHSTPDPYPLRARSIYGRTKDMALVVTCDGIGNGAWAIAVEGKDELKEVSASSLSYPYDLVSVPFSQERI
jgi:hypothetical protein